MKATTLKSLDAELLNSETFHVEVRVVNESLDSVGISIFPGFWLLTYDDNNMLICSHHK
jgi:hypothetical protein